MAVDHSSQQGQSVCMNILQNTQTQTIDCVCLCLAVLVCGWVDACVCSRVVAEML